MRRLTFTNSRGESITLDSKAPYMLTSLEGTGATDVDIQMQKAPFQDGETYTDTLLDPRELSIEGSILAYTNHATMEHRRTLSRVFNPKLGEGLLKFEYDGGEKEIRALAEGGPVFPNRQGEMQKFLITLICPEPFWMDTYKTSKQMSFLMGGLSFPLFLGTPFSQRSFRRVFTNSGDVSTPVNIEFYGPAINPIVRNNTTGEYIQVNRDLTETDVLVIDTTFGRKRVEIRKPSGESENVFNWIDLQSTFFRLEVGENEIEYNSNNDSDKSRVIVSYRNRFVGI